MGNCDIITGDLSYMGGVIFQHRKLMRNLFFPHVSYARKRFIQHDPSPHLAVPAEGQVLGVVRHVVIVVVTVPHRVLLVRLLPLLSRPRLLPDDVLTRGRTLLGQQLGESVDLSLETGDLSLLLTLPDNVGKLNHIQQINMY